MTLHLHRTFTKGEITGGLLTIDGLLLCDTLENSRSCPKAGRYPLTLVKCKQYARKMICLGDKVSCAACVKQKLVQSNTPLLRQCPMIKPGNGICNRHDGSILVGTQVAPGCLIHPKEAFDTLYGRIRKNVERGNEVWLEIH